MKERTGIARRIDAFLVGDEIKPEAVQVDTVDADGDAMIEQVMMSKVDIDRMDFFMPLLLLVLIYFFSWRGVTYVSIILQLALLRDMYVRMGRRPSGRVAVGMAPPTVERAWVKAFGLYFASLPVMIAGKWINNLVIALLFSGNDAHLRNIGRARIATIPEIILAVVFILMLIMFAVVLGPLTEELWFRGIGMAGFMNTTRSPLQAVLWTSAIFAVLHGSSRILDCFVFGVVMAMIRFRTGSLHCSICIHAFHNFMVVVLAFARILF